jgi:hypothetical protein
MTGRATFTGYRAHRHGVGLELWEVYRCQELPARGLPDDWRAATEIAGIRFICRAGARATCCRSPRGCARG